MTTLFHARFFDGTDWIQAESFDFSPQSGRFEGWCFKHRAPTPAFINAGGHFVCPGFVDLQVNGGGGVMLNTQPNEHALQTMCHAHAKLGTTSLLATCITDAPVVSKNAIAAVHMGCGKIPGLLGIHLEGPYISPNKKGIHPEHWIRAEDPLEWQALAHLPKGCIVLVTLAPECVSENFLTHIRKHWNGVIFAGHSFATDAHMQQAFANGVTGVTHTFNACSPLTSRDIGVVGAALLNPHIFCSLIADGFHVCWRTWQAALRMRKGSHNVFLVSDAMGPCGTSQKNFFVGDRKIQVDPYGCYRDEQGTLAGASLSLHQGVQRLVQSGVVGLGDALRMATSTPARAVRAASVGVLASGFFADFVLLHKETLDLLGVWQRGIRVL